MDSSGECMINDANLMTIGRGSHVFGVILGSYQEWESREVKYEAAEQRLRTVVDTTPALTPICMIDLTCNVWMGCTSLLLWRPRG